MAAAVIAIFVVLVIILLATNIKIVPQAHSYVVEELGAYKETWDVGLHFKIPFIGKMISAAGYISINRESPREGAKAIFKARDFLKNNICNVLIFPEGTRNKTDNILLPMHAGSLKPAFSAKKNVVVCSIKNIKKIHFSIIKTKIIVKVIDVLNPNDYESDVYMKDKIEELIKNDLLNAD